MSTVATIHVDLEFDIAADPVEGRLSAAGGAPEPFTGWIELAAALERLRVPAGSAGEPAREGRSSAGLGAARAAPVARA
jgi:hypothetical protein